MSTVTVGAETRHLTDEALRLLDAPDADRIYCIKESVWIDHPTVEEIMLALEDAISAPQIHRMPWMLIHGPGASGKTALLLEFLAQHKATRDAKLEADKQPIVFISGGGGSGGEAALYRQIMLRLGSNMNIGRTEDRKTHVAALMSAMGVRMLIIDEAHDFLIGSHRERRQFWSALKYLGNDGRRSIVMAGTEALLSGLLSDDQIDTRFEEEFPMHRWREGTEWTNFLMIYEAGIPLRKESMLWQPTLANWLLDRSDGLTGIAVTLMKAAAVYAIRDKSEQITLKTFEKMPKRKLRTRP